MLGIKFFSLDMANVLIITKKNVYKTKIFLK